LVTEIPEHLLRRSKERRAALSGEESEGAATTEAAAVVSETRAAPPVPAGGAPATQAGGGGAATPTTGVPLATEPPAAPRIRRTRPGIPIWIMPVLIGLPLWGIIYLGAFGNRAKANANDPVAIGGTLFSANCATCHGANGEGGVGPQLNSGQVLRVWPKVADHVNWVKTGGAPYVGKTIGATNIPVPANSVMPGFASSLSDLQIRQVVCYERVTFGGEKESAQNCPGFTG
jgi:mono/diheme cytochrome c family protein